MISNIARREIAARLAREARAWKETFPESECDFSDAAAMMQDLCVFIGLERNALCSEVFQRLADLIDRPTCRNVSEYQDVFTCSECRCKVEIIGEECNEYGECFCAPFMPSFCLNCGKEVVE